MDAAAVEKGRRKTRRSSQDQPHKTPQGNTAWSAEDDDKLRYLLCVDKISDWNDISSKIGSKGAAACKERWEELKPLPESSALDRRFWTLEEDDTLKATVDKYGKNWMLVACYVKGRTSKQCHERYRSHEPGVKRGKLSKEEWDTVCRLQKELGNKWTEIAKALKNRSSDVVKNAWYLAKSKTLKAEPKEPGSGSAESEHDEDSPETINDGANENTNMYQGKEESFDLGLEVESMEVVESSSRKRKTRMVEKAEPTSRKRRRVMKPNEEGDGEPILATVVAEVLDEEYRQELAQTLTQQPNYYLLGPQPFFYPGSMPQNPMLYFNPMVQPSQKVQYDTQSTPYLGSSTDQTAIESQDFMPQSKYAAHGQEGMEVLETLCDLANDQQAHTNPITQPEPFQYQYYHPMNGIPCPGPGYPIHPYWLSQFNVTYQSQFSLQHQIQLLQNQPIMRPILPTSMTGDKDEAPMEFASIGTVNDKARSNAVTPSSAQENAQ